MSRDIKIAPFGHLNPFHFGPSFWYHISNAFCLHFSSQNTSILAPKRSQNRIQNGARISSTKRSILGPILAPFWVPHGLQNRSKMRSGEPPGASRDPPGSLQSLRGASGSLREPPGSLPGPSGASIFDSGASLFYRILIDFGSIFDSFF